MNMVKEYKYMVATRCFTYNHAPYIVDAMNGFVMQETTFPVVTCIVDDASTDGEQDVIKRYITEHFQAPYRTEDNDDYQLICAKHNTNPNCIFVVFLLKYNHYSIKKAKAPYLREWDDNVLYYASCEGDDYWIATDKLQKQVEFLEINPDCEMVCSASKIYVQGVGMKKGIHGHPYRGIEELLKGNFIFNASVVKRKSLNDRYLQEIGSHPDWKMGDWPRILHCAIVSKIGYMDEPMAVYRVLPNSASHFESFDKFKSFYENSVSVSKFFIDKYDLDADSLYPILDEWLNQRLLMKACSVGNVALVNQYKRGVNGLSTKEKIIVFLSCHPFTNVMYGWFKKTRKFVGGVWH